MPQLSIFSVGLILLVASLAAMLSRRLGMPYSIGLVVAGFVLAFVPGTPDLPLTPTLIFHVLLPPLVFEAALQLEWNAFRRNLSLTAALAFPGVLIAAAAVAAGMHGLCGWSWIGSALFGVLIAATDPVAVISAFKEMKVDSRLSLLVEAESLLNDGAAAVGFSVLVAIAGGAALTFGDVAGSLIVSVAGGVAAGLVVAGGLLVIAGQTEDHLVELTLTTIAAYGSFLLAERFHMSGVLASLSAGLLVGNVGLISTLSNSGRAYVLAFWEYAAFLANSIVFILIGRHVALQPIGSAASASCIAIALVLLGRALAVYPVSATFSKTRIKISLAYQHVLLWGGLRGALALALALATPDSVAEREQIVVVSFAVVAFSIFVQGLTMPKLVARLGLLRNPVAAAGRDIEIKDQKKPAG